MSSTRAWTAAELDRADTSDELDIASARPDGALRPAVTIWLVRVGDDLYVRSAHGPQNGWFRRALAAGTGRVTFGGQGVDVTFEPAPDDVHPALDAAYRTKYARYDPHYVEPVVSALAATATLRVVPRA
ncbi:MAG TPA: DUF2255 family protein [Cellulomonas sp.]